MKFKRKKNTERWRFEEWVCMMIVEKRTQEKSFRSALSFWGRQRLEKIWKEYQEEIRVQQEEHRKRIGEKDV